MTKHTAPLDDATIDAALRRLVPAPKTELSDPERERAEATFARIVATPTDAPVSAVTIEPGSTAKTRRRRNRLLIAAGFVCTAAVTGVAVPGLLFGGDSAYASWTPTPEPLTGEAADAAAATCYAALDVQNQGERVTVAERRGQWTYILLAGPKAQATCLMPDDLIGAQGPGEQSKDGFFGSYSPDPSPAPALDADGIEETTSMDGSTDEGWFVWAEGYVGSDVTGVTVQTSSGLNITASVVDGRFAAWWPAVVQSSDNPDGESWSYTVHLADGSQRIDRAP